MAFEDKIYFWISNVMTKIYVEYTDVYGQFHALRATGLWKVMQGGKKVRAKPLVFPY